MVTLNGFALDPYPPRSNSPTGDPTIPPLIYDGQLMRENPAYVYAEYELEIDLCCHEGVLKSLMPEKIDLKKAFLPLSLPRPKHSILSE